MRVQLPPSAPCLTNTQKAICQINYSLQDYYNNNHKSIKEYIANMSTLIIIPCGKRKIWGKDPKAGPTKAQDVYTGGHFKVNRQYAEKFAPSTWIILSAKYGFINPDFIICKDYNVRFGDFKAISTERLRRQISRKHFKKYRRIIALGGVDYTNRIAEVFSGIKDIVTPVKGLRSGQKMKWLKMRIKQGRML